MLFCSKWDPRPRIACIERRFAFEIDWADAQADDDVVVDRGPGQAHREGAPRGNRYALKTGAHTAERRAFRAEVTDRFVGYAVVLLLAIEGRQA